MQYARLKPEFNLPPERQKQRRSTLLATPFSAEPDVRRAENHFFTPCRGARGVYSSATHRNPNFRLFAFSYFPLSILSSYHLRIFLLTFP